MNTFRAFVLDENNRIVRSEILAASSDDEALQAARAFADESDLEIWQGSRRIALMLKGGEIRPFTDGQAT